MADISCMDAGEEFRRWLVEIRTLDLHVCQSTYRESVIDAIVFSQVTTFTSDQVVSSET